MRHVSVTCVLVAALAAALGCGDNDTTRPTGPVTVKFVTDVIGTDTVKAEIILDDTIHLTVPGNDSIVLPRGDHKFVARLNIDYLRTGTTFRLDPSGNREVLPIFQACSYRTFQFDETCLEYSAIYWRTHTRLVCPANDFGDLCSVYPDFQQLGLTWPDTASAAALNSYVRQGKLLIAATMGAGNQFAGQRLAMSLDTEGDYSPHRRLHPIAGDTARWQEEIWTDARHIPLYPADRGILANTDRRGKNFGLAVRMTSFLPPAQPNAILFRFDVKNISATDSFRFVHPEEPVSGHTLTDIYLTPFFDPDVGGRVSGEESDDNATVFPAESLLVAYDQKFSVPQAIFAGGYHNKPGLVGFLLIDGPPGTTAKAVLTNPIHPLDYETALLEDSSYAIISAGRGGPLDSDCSTSSSFALICTAETQTNIRYGWSVGPVPSLAPGDSTFVVVALMMAVPQGITSGNDVPPENNNLASTTRPIYTIASQLRSLASQVRTIVVNGAPGLRR
jgi:hypothetical protein